MDELLEFINQHLSFLCKDFDEHRVTSLEDGFVAVIVLQFGHLNIRFVRDRGQIFMDFQNRSRDKKEWFSLGIVSQLLTKDFCKNEVMDAGWADFVRIHFKDICNAFSDEMILESEKAMKKFERERGRRLFDS